MKTGARRLRCLARQAPAFKEYGAVEKKPAPSRKIKLNQSSKQIAVALFVALRRGTNKGRKVVRHRGPHHSRPGSVQWPARQDGLPQSAFGTAEPAAGVSNRAA